MKKLSTYLILLLIGLSVFGQNKEEKIGFNNWVLEITDCDSLNIPNYFEDQKQIDSISKIYGNWHKRSEAVEQYLLDKYDLDIKIDSISRIVKLKRGRKIRMTPYPNIEYGYTFEKEFKEYNAYLFRVQWGEGNNYFLLNIKNGKRFYMIGRLYFSKDGKYAMSINDDLEARYSVNGFQLFRVSRNNNLHLLWQYEPDWEPKEMLWIDSETLVVRAYHLSENDYWEGKTVYKKMKITQQ